MTPPPFLDTNVLLRHLLADDPQQSPRATAYLRQVESGEMTVHTSDIVVFETVFTLQRQFGVAKADIREAVLPLLELSGVMLPGKRRYRRVFDLYADLNLPFADAYHVVLMQQQGLDHVVSFDRDFDRIPGLRRVEP